MNPLRPSVAAFAALLLVALAGAAESFDDAMRQEAASFQARQQQAAATLQQTRERVAAEKIPLLRDLRAAQDRLIHAETDARRIETDQAHAAETRRQLVRQIDEAGRSAVYLQTLMHDALKTVADGLAPGETQLVSAKLDTLRATLDRAPAGARATAAADGAEFLLAHVEAALGGRTAAGQSLDAGDSRLYTGVFAFSGPETFFRSDDGAHFGSVRAREGSPLPTTFAVRSWRATEATAFFQTGAGLIPVDASGGKALRLAETRGSLWDHIQKGGYVALAILVAGALALGIIAQKIAQVIRMRVEPPDRVRRFLATVAAGDYAEAERQLAALRGVIAELFTAGLAQRDAPKAVVEEVLQSVLLEQRLLYERRLPLLAVIATAAPLMGLLGTVVGMVRTFALITVFGTGNAGKLSSGISEVLVATELGLVVAIPTLIAHGFLAHRIHKNLGLAEKAALQFVTALELSRSDAESTRTLVK